jgi:multicomponent Na+:H+ antiporter subunit F
MDLLDAASVVTLGTLTAAAVLCFVRLLVGPTLADRVVAIDLMGVLIVGLLVVASHLTRESAFLDVAMVLALVSFVGTVAYARYIERERQS